MKAWAILHYYKKLDEQDDGASATFCLLSDTEAKLVLMAWKGYPVPWKAPTGDAPDTQDSRAWDWLWKGCRPDFDVLAARANVLPSVIRGKFDLLRGNRLIYPDGTINPWADRILRAEIAQRYPTRRPAAPKPPPQGGPK